ncbi:hypothetical protein ACLOJK_021164 [Asimina triloba]
MEWLRRATDGEILVFPGGRALKHPDRDVAVDPGSGDLHDGELEQRRGRRSILLVDSSGRCRADGPTTASRRRQRRIEAAWVDPVARTATVGSRAAPGFFPDHGDGEQIDDSLPWQGQIGDRQQEKNPIPASSHHHVRSSQRWTPIQSTARSMRCSTQTPNCIIHDAMAYTARHKHFMPIKGSINPMRGDTTPLGAFSHLTSLSSSPMEERGRKGPSAKVEEMAQFGPSGLKRARRAQWA